MALYTSLLCFKPRYLSLYSNIQLDFGPKTSRPSQVGEVMGISESIISLSNAFIPIFATMIYSIIGYQIYWYTRCYQS